MGPFPDCAKAQRQTMKIAAMTTLNRLKLSDCHGIRISSPHEL
jgi:hypothetical protein